MKYKLMYITKNYKFNSSSDQFDWKSYFECDYQNITFDFNEIIAKLREMYQENAFLATMSIATMLKKLLLNIDISKPRIIELGAATGLLTRCLLSKYSGSAVLIDNCKESLEKYNSLDHPFKDKIFYYLEDIFSLSINESFDLVCSYGLIEHFKLKDAVLNAHIRLVKDNGYIIICVPADTLLTRTFFMLHPEQGVGYRELLTVEELKMSCIDMGLKVINSCISSGYVFNSVAVVCQK
jgi:SAM-dependent methyltransferase